MLTDVIGSCHTEFQHNYDTMANCHFSYEKNHWIKKKKHFKMHNKHYSVEVTSWRLFLTFQLINVFL